MPSQLSNNFTARVVMRADTAGGPVRWANTHEFDATGWTGDLFVNVGTLAGAVVTMHRNLLNAAFLVESVTISSAADDGKPYNPETFYTRTVMVRGDRGDPALSTQLLPLTNVLHVKKMVSAGREGNMLLRGFLNETDIQSDPLTGAIALTNAQQVSTEVATAWGAFNSAVTSGGAKMVLMKVEGGVVSQVRDVTGMTVKGHTSKKLNNKYFNRDGGGLGGAFDGLVDTYGPIVVSRVIEYLTASGGTMPPLLP